MRIYILDANAVIRYLSRGLGEEKVDALIQRAAKGEARLAISVINWGEVLYSMARIIGLNRASADLKALSALVESVAVDAAQTEAAAIIRLHYKLGYADCFAAALAMRMNATLVTADPDFAKLGKKLKILSLSRHLR
jgi:predicted nucleic acid-binding protein